MLENKLDPQATLSPCFYSNRKKNSLLRKVYRKRR